jgi:E3 ubiquitin-protein ligase RFWD2
MWSRSSDQSVAVLHAPGHSPVCCAEFAPSSSFLLALACADSNVYVNDLRKLSSPVLTLSHHKRAASYVRFLGRDCLVSAAIDSTLKLWDISASVDHCLNGESDRLDLKKTIQHPLKTFGYHRNARNFVGLSVWAEGGLIACGSETNEAFAYDCHQGEPILRHDFGEENFPVPGGFGVSGSAGRKDMDDCLVEDQGKLMVSAVCWRQSKESECTLVAANSVGILRLIKGFRN